MRTFPRFVWMLAALLSLVSVLASRASAQTNLSFNRDIRPILADVCFQCHGPDPGSRKGDLRLDREEGFFGGDEPLVVKGKPEQSPLVVRIMSSDREQVMPPPEAHKQLSPRQKELIRRWVAEGAVWQPHWSFIPPQRAALPEVKNNAWARNPIDRFVLSKLEAIGLSPNGEADPATLCRRVYLDVTGLPPTPEQVDEFVSSYSTVKSGEPSDAYAALVAKLLDSPRYGEHRARYWLDAARYADTHGLHFDNYREIWPYRDWVVRAFNRNQPFDQFTIEQIAGDLLPNASDEQRLATGFHRCNITTNEGGTIADENLANYARDRVETTAWVWLGLTANCAVCHDHKFDPITMRDFYSMSAFFRNTTQGALDGNVKDSKPIMFLPQPEDSARFTAINGELAAARDAQAKRRREAAATIEAWQKTVKADELNVDSDKLALHAPLNEGKGNDFKVIRAQAQKPTCDLDLSVDAKSPKGTSLPEVDWEWRKDGKLGPAPVLSQSSTLHFNDVGDFDRDQPFSVALWVRPGERLNDGALLVHLPSKGDPQGWELVLQGGGKLTFALHTAKPKGMIRVTTRNSIAKPGAWVHIAAIYDGSGKNEGLQMYVNGVPVDGGRQGNPLTSSTRTEGPVFVGQRPNKVNHLTDGAVQDVRVYGRRLLAGEVKTLAQLADLRNDAAVALEKRTPQQKDRLTNYFLENVDQAYGAAVDKQQQLEDEQKAMQSRAVVTHIQEEKPNSPAMANILMRGQYDKPGEKVTPDVFAALNPLADSAPKNRLGLAQWLVDAKNPLASRVTVNRYWQELFGVGLVKTAEDFGIMGDAPSHPELLDWLAVEFRESGWNVKQLFKLLLTSATYRQAAVTTPAKLEKDRENRLLSRGPRFRLDAEMIRDYALSVSGTLSARMGGPGTKPYQPEGLWDIVGLPGGNTRDYKQDTGENLYRRSVYTFWKRMSPPPNMETFNAPSREFSCLRRERTNTPLQALITLNDPQFVEAARNTAQAVLKQTGGDSRKTLDVAAKRILCRALKSDEAKLIEPAVAEMLAYYQANKEAARQLIQVGESQRDSSLDPATLAAWTNVCSTLFNLDEVLNK